MSIERAAQPTPSEIASFLPYACEQLMAPFHVSVRFVIIEDYVSKQDDKGKKTKRDKEIDQSDVTSTQHAVPSNKGETMMSAFDSNARDYEEVEVTVVCDPVGRLVELAFHCCPHIPRLLLKVIALCVPYQPMLSKITIRRSRPKGLVLYEMAKILTQSYITEICLDDSPVLERNYYVLFEQLTKLRSLSLARCNLDDEDCIVLASKLRHPEPASRSLALLCLASNMIKDAGAAALGNMLRSNRTLRHLNVADNRITDDGASKIFRSLARFHLTADEILAMRKRHFDYIKLKEIVYAKCYNELVAGMADKALEEKNSVKRKTASRIKRSSTVSIPQSKSALECTLALKADTMADALVGPLADPFCEKETVSMDHVLYSQGNMTLCYVNLAFNDLEYASVLLLEHVLRYQTKFQKADGGLLRVVLDGNRLGSSGELAAVDELVSRALTARGQSKLSPRRSERAKSRVRQ